MQLHPHIRSKPTRYRVVVLTSFRPAVDQDRVCQTVGPVLKLPGKWGHHSIFPLVDLPRSSRLFARLDRRERIFLGAAAGINFISGDLTGASTSHRTRLASTIWQRNAVSAGALRVAWPGVCVGAREPTGELHGETTAG